MRRREYTYRRRRIGPLRFELYRQGRFGTTHQISCERLGLIATHCSGDEVSGLSGWLLGWRFGGETHQAHLRPVFELGSGRLYVDFMHKNLSEAARRHERQRRHELEHEAWCDRSGAEEGRP